MLENTTFTTNTETASEAEPAPESKKCLGEKIRRLMKSKKLTQQQVADTIGVPASTFATWLTGRSKPKAAAATALSEALGVSLEYLTSDLSEKGEQILQSFASRLTTLLWKKGLSQSEFARQSGYSAMVVSHWMNGKSRPRYEDLLRISEFFEVSVGFLLGQETSPDFPEPTTKDVKDSFRRTFMEIVLKSGLSQTDIGKMLGVTPQQVNKWLTGTNKPTHEILLKISKIFNVSIDFLLGNENQTTADAEVESKKEAEITAGADELTQPLPADLGNTQFQKTIADAVLKEFRELYSIYNGSWLSLAKAAKYCDMSIAHFNKLIRPLVPEDKGSRPVIFCREKLDAAMESRQIGNLPSSRKGPTSTATRRK